MKRHFIGAGAGALALALLVGGPTSAATDGTASLTAADIAHGKVVYKRECVMCHGASGDGEGAAAHLLTPRPRNFQLGVFKLRSTASGQPPTDADLFRTITEGLPGSMMPAFRELSERERWALVAVVKGFAGGDKPGTSIVVPPPPPVTAERLAQGKEVYNRLKCFNCHGVEGLGDGPSALTLKDDGKMRIWAPDLTRGMFKSGGDPLQLHLRIATGLDGTPMPSYAAQATSDEIWALVQYLKSLVKP